MEKTNSPSKVNSKPSSRESNPAPNWQSSVDKSLSGSIQTSAPPALDSDLLCSISDNLPDESEDVSLSELATQYSSFLPLRVKIVTGFCAENDKDPTLDIDDIYNIHLLKHTDLVTIRDISGEHYNIPLYSSLRFGLIYEPTNETKTFSSINEILSAKPLPKVVVALEQYDGRSEKTSLSPNDLLVIQSVNKHGIRKSSLKAYCVTSSTKKDLQSECAVRFTTDPRLTKMYLSDMMEFVYDLLPCNARLYFDESTVSLPQHLSHEIVTVEEKRTNSSFLISLEVEKHRRGKRIEVKELVDIPTCIGIDVNVLSPHKSESRYKKLYEDTSRLLKEFNPTEVQACVDAPSDDVYVTQAQLLAQIRRGYENVGLNIERPAIIGDYECLLASTMDSAADYEDIDSIKRKEPKKSPRSTPSVLPTTGVHVQPTKARKPPPPSAPQYEDIDFIETRGSPRSASGVLPTTDVRVQLAKAYKPPPPGVPLPSVPPRNGHHGPPPGRPPPPGVPPPTGVSSTGRAVPPPPTGVPSTGRTVPPPPPGVSSTGHAVPLPLKTPPSGIPPSGIPPTVPRKTQSIPSKAQVKSNSREVVQSTNRLPSLPPRNASFPAQDSKVEQNEKSHESKSILTADKNTSPVSADVKKALASLENTVTLLKMGSQLCERMNLVEKQLSSMAADVKQLKAVGSVGVGSLQSLQLMSRDDVLHLLDNLNMPQYKESFKREMVDGEILSEIDEVVLEQELGMKSKIHRLRFLKYIDSCRTSAT